jgi:hypothetical protein
MASKPGGQWGKKPLDRRVDGCRFQDVIKPIPGKRIFLYVAGRSDRIAPSIRREDIPAVAVLLLLFTKTRNPR